MDVNFSKSTTNLDERTRRNYQLMAPRLKRTCLSAESALTGRPNIEDVTLGAKLPMIPGNKLILYTTNLCKKLHLPSCDFDRTYPSDVYVSNEYRCLHDPHLRRFFVDKPEMRTRLYRKGYITSEQKVICSLKEYNLYRQYLKHLSIVYWNQKYLEQYEAEKHRNQTETKRAIRKRQRDVDNPITKRINRARANRKVIDNVMDARRTEILRLAHEHKRKREIERKQERLRRIVREETREKEREGIKRQNAVRQTEERIIWERLLNQKHEEDIQRKKMFEEKKKAQWKEKERISIQAYEKKKMFHQMKMAELQRLLAEEEVKRKARIASWEDFFDKKQEKQTEKLEQMKEKVKTTREKQKKVIEARLRRRGWTGAPCKRISDRVQEFGDAGKFVDPEMVQRLSAMGFHSVMLSPNVLKYMLSENVKQAGKQSSGDGASRPARPTLSDHARHLCDEIVRQGFASEYVRRTLEAGQELVSTSRDMVHQIIDVSHNVLLPMLQAYEKRTGIQVTSTEIPKVLRELCSGVFDEEEDDLPQLVSFRDNKATLSAGKKDSNVRFVVSNTDLPLEHRLHKNRPPTPKRRVKFSSEDSESDEPHELVSEETIIAHTINSLSQMVVDEVYESDLFATPDMNREEMQERITQLSGAIVDDVIAFGAGTGGVRVHSRSSSPASSNEEDSLASVTSLEAKISYLARRMISEVVCGKLFQDKDGGSVSSSSSLSTSHSDISILAIRVVRSIMDTVDPATSMTIREQAALNVGLEMEIAKLSAKVVEEVIKENRKQKADEETEIDEAGYAELEEKISTLALSIVTSVVEGKPPGSSTNVSLCSADMEERVSDLSTRIIAAILSLKKILPTIVKQNDRQEVKKAKPTTSIEKILQEIINLDALQNSPKGAFRNLTKKDIEKMSDNFARKLVPPRDDSSALSSGMSQLAIALANDAVGKIVDQGTASTVGSSAERAVDTLAEVLVTETLIEKKIASEESKLSSGISAIADEITEEALTENMSTQSGLSSGASHLAGALTGETMERVMKSTAGHSTSSAIDSAISNLAITAADDGIAFAKYIDSSTRSAISSGIKELAAKIAEQTLDRAAADPSALGGSTRSAISIAASQLAAHIAEMVTDQGRPSATKLESVISSAVGNMVAEILTSCVVQKIREQGHTEECQDLAKEVGKLVQNILGLGSSESFPSGEVKLSKKSSCTIESGVSELASDIVTELMNVESYPAHRVSEKSSALSAVATQYVYQVLGLKPVHPLSERAEEKIVAVEATEFDSVPEYQGSSQNLDQAADDIANALLGQSSSTNAQNPRPPRTGQTKGNLKGKSTGNLQKTTQKSSRKQQNTNFSSFHDWRQSQNPGDRVKSLSALQSSDSVELRKSLSYRADVMGDFNASISSSTELNNILGGLAARIVSSALKHESNVGDTSQFGSGVNESRSVEQLIGTLALGVVTSLLGLDVLNSASDCAQTEENRTSSENEPPSPTPAPEPSSGIVKAEEHESFKDRIPEKHGSRHINEEHLGVRLKIFNPEDVTSTSNCRSYDTFSCQDNASDHPHRVPSPSRKAMETKAKRHAYKGNKKSLFPRLNNWLEIGSKNSLSPSGVNTPKQEQERRAHVADNRRRIEHQRETTATHQKRRQNVVRNIHRSSSVRR